MELVKYFLPWKDQKTAFSPAGTLTKIPLKTGLASKGPEAVLPKIDQCGKSLTTPCRLSSRGSLALTLVRGVFWSGKSECIAEIQSVVARDRSVYNTGFRECYTYANGERQATF